MNLLDGKVALITGAGHGIGRATARLFAQHGARLVINDLGGARDGSGQDQSAADELVKELGELGAQAVANYANIATADGASSAVAQAVSTYGALDVLINNAGIVRDKTLLKMDLAQWESVLAVHLTGSFLCLQAAAAVMKDRGEGGSIINTTSVSGMLGNFGQANYSAAKAGVYGLTRTASIELQRYKIRVNAVAPLAKTRMTEDLPLFEKIEHTLTPEHVAPAHLFLASDLSRDISGVVLSVAGGRLSTYKVVETAGKYKEADAGVWTAAEIAEHFGTISK